MGRIFGKKEISKKMFQTQFSEKIGHKNGKKILSLNVRMVIFIKLARLSHLLSFPSLFETLIFFARFLRLSYFLWEIDVRRVDGSSLRARRRTSFSIYVFFQFCQFTLGDNSVISINCPFLPSHISNSRPFLFVSLPKLYLSAFLLFSLSGLCLFLPVCQFITVTSPCNFRQLC